MSDPAIDYQGSYCGANMVPGNSLIIHNPVNDAAAAQLIMYPPVDSGGLTLEALTTLIDALPTTLPATSGQLWLNGGIVAVS